MALDLPHATRGFSVADLSPEGQRNHIAGRALVVNLYAKQAADELAEAQRSMRLRLALADLLAVARDRLAECRDAGERDTLRRAIYRAEAALEVA